MTSETARQTVYRIETNSAPSDAAWDDWVAATPGGQHVQTSLWAQVKATLGWRAVRIQMHDHSQLVAGAQLLLKPLPLIGAMAYVPKGPLFWQPSAEVVEQMLSALHRVARANRVQYLVVQPPDDDASMEACLMRHGFRESVLDVAPTASVRIDVAQDVDTILSGMKAKTRYNIRHGERRGIAVRLGTRQDLPLFYDALLATSRRQGFMPYPLSYFEVMARVFEPRGQMKWLIATYRGEPVSILLALRFGHTVVYKKGAWFGRHGEHHPNEVLHWAAIKWAKSQGCHYYDLEGIEPQAARALLRGEALPEPLRGTVSHFKAGFGGEVLMLPRPYDYLYNPILRRAFQIVQPNIAHAAAFSKLREWLHKRC